METISQGWYKLHIICIHLLFSCKACCSTELPYCQQDISTAALNSFFRFLSQTFNSLTFLFPCLFMSCCLWQHYFSQCTTTLTAYWKPTPSHKKPENFPIVLTSGVNVSMHMLMHYFHVAIYMTAYQRSYLSPDPTLNLNLKNVLCKCICVSPH